MPIEVRPGSGKVVNAMMKVSEGKKSDLQFILGKSDVHHRRGLFGDGKSIPAVVVTPAHREKEIAVLQDQENSLPKGVIPIVHINDHPLGLHNQYPGRFYTRVRENEAKVSRIDGVRYVIANNIAFGDLEPPPTITKKIKGPYGTFDREYHILGPLISKEKGWLNYFELFGPFALLSEVDHVLNGRMQNMLLKQRLVNSPDSSNVVVIDSSHIRELSHDDERYHSIGRARALPIYFLRQQNVLAETPIFWNDADTYFEPGALEKAIQYYNDYPNIIGTFFSRRPILPSPTTDVYQLQKHAGSELVNAMKWLTERKLSYMGGPQISNRFRWYYEALQVFSMYCTDRTCDEEDCDHARVSYQGTLLDMLANITDDEDFAFTDVLRVLSTTEQPMVWLPERVWVNIRGKERQHSTAVNGDAGNDMHEYPDLMESYRNLTEEIIAYLSKKGVTIEAKTLIELMSNLQKREDFVTILEQERNQYTVHGLARLGPDPHEKLYSYYGDPKITIEKAVQLYALQTYLLSLEIK